MRAIFTICTLKLNIENIEWGRSSQSTHWNFVHWKWILSEGNLHTYYLKIFIFHKCLLRSSCNFDLLRGNKVSKCSWDIKKWSWEKNSNFEKKKNRNFQKFHFFFNEKSIFQKLRIFKVTFNYQFLRFLYDSRCKNHLLDQINSKIKK